MTKIKLQKMMLRNFKGIKDFVLEPNGKSINVLGDNGTGKTTLYDAFLWALFGKDSTDKATFDWKPLDEHNNEIHRLETEVTLNLTVDDTPVELGRMTKEKWTRKRGSPTESFDGHQTTYTRNGLKIKKSEYDKYINGLIDEETFKMLTNVYYFSEIMHWKDRREILTGLADPVDETELIAENKDFKAIDEIRAESGLETVDENVQYIKQQLRQANQDLKELPNRLDEVDRSFPKVDPSDEPQLTASVKQAHEALDALRAKQEKAKPDTIADEIEREIKDLELEVKRADIDFREANEERAAKAHRRALEQKEKVHELEAERQEHFSRAEYLSEQADGYQAEKERLYREFSAIKDRVMPPFDEEELKCPTCHREYSEEKQAEIKEAYEEKTQANNLKCSQSLAEITERGRELNGLIEDAEKGSADHLDAANELKKKLGELSKDGYEAEEEELPQFEKTADYKALKEKIDQKKGELKDVRQSLDEWRKEWKAQAAEIEQQISNHNEELAEIALYKRQEARKKELIAHELKLNKHYGELENRLFILEEFGRVEMDALTDSINEKFKEVKFNLFKQNINGGIEPVCEATVGGVSYTTGLNNAARINAGLDIIDTLMKHEGINVPIFIDNAEAVNRINKIDTQIITLTVSEDKELRVEEEQR